MTNMYAITMSRDAARVLCSGRALSRMQRDRLVGLVRGSWQAARVLCSARDLTRTQRRRLQALAKSAL